MTQKEFETRTEMNLTSDEFNRVHDLYVGAGDLDKDEFCADFKKHSDSVILNAYFTKSAELEAKHDVNKKKQTSIAHFLIKKSMVGGDKDMIQMAISMIGEQNYIQYKLENKYSLFEYDKELIITLINK